VPTHRETPMDMLRPRRVTAGFVTALLVLLLTACDAGRGPDGPLMESVTIRDETFRLEVARDEPARTKGLMERESIPADGGMLFIFPDAQLRAFWMANCLVDIDVIFLDPQGRITAMHRMKAGPARRPDESEVAYETRMRDSYYASVFPAQFAIELQAGTLDRLALDPAEKIPLDLPRLKALAQ